MSIQIFPCSRIHTELQKLRSGLSVLQKESKHMIAARFFEHTQEFLDVSEKQLTLCERILHQDLELKKEEDIAKLEEMEEKTQKNESLTREDLLFLYEVDFLIQPFEGKDERIKALRDGRDPQQDLLIMLSPDQISRTQQEVTPKTKVYIGELFPKIFTLSHLEQHIYTEFPERPIRQERITIGGKTKEELCQELADRRRLPSGDKNKISISAYIEHMLESAAFFTLEQQENFDFIVLTVKELGFPNGASIPEIKRQSAVLGLEVCPPETGLRLCLYNEEFLKKYCPINVNCYILMEPISVSGGNKHVFALGSSNVLGRKFYSEAAAEYLRFGSSEKIVFRLPASER